LFSLSFDLVLILRNFFIFSLVFFLILYAFIGRFFDKKLLGKYLSKYVNGNYDFAVD